MAAHSPEETHAVVETAINAGDLDALVEIYEENATLIVPPGGVEANGREEIRRALEPMLALRPTAELRVVKKLQSDGLALTYGRWIMNSTDAEGQSVRLTGAGTIVSRRQPDGSWLIALDNPYGGA